MYNAKVIIPGLVALVVLITVPIWYNLGTGKADYFPQPQISSQSQNCVESAEFMRDNHMQLLLDWRESVVRDGVHTYHSSSGQQFEMSLTGSCLECHSNKVEFCDQCHNYTGITPNCWECHVIPGENK